LQKWQNRKNSQSGIITAAKSAAEQEDITGTSVFAVSVSEKWHIRA
jgi:hypothetical protein